MKKALVIVVIFFIGVLGYFVLGNKYEIKNIPPKNETILIFGDSLAKGVGSTESGNLASLIEKRLGKPVLNYGESGDTTSDSLKRLSIALKENAGIVIIILGGNDVLKKIPKEETFSNLEKIITSFQNNGSVAVLVGIRSGLVGDGRGNEYSKLAKKMGAVYISDILKDVFGNFRYMSDPIHPNDDGYALIAGRLYPVLIELIDG